MWNTGPGVDSTCQGDRPNVQDHWANLVSSPWLGTTEPFGNPVVPLVYATSARRSAASGPDGPDHRMSSYPSTAAVSLTSMPTAAPAERATSRWGAWANRTEAPESVRMNSTSAGASLLLTGTAAAPTTWHAR